MRLAQQGTEIGARLIERLRRQSVSFDRLARKLARRLDADGVHDLRVLVRRLRAAFWVARQLLPYAVGGRLRMDLRCLGRALGLRRMLNVAVEDARTYGLDASKIGERTEAAGRRVQTLLQPKRRADLCAEMQRVRDALSGEVRDRLDVALGRRAKRLRRALVRVRTAGTDVQEQCHALRIEAKKTRYVLEALGRPGRFIRPLQRRLGRAHDLEIVQELLGPCEGAAREEGRERVAARRMMTRVVARAIKGLTG